MLQVTEKAERIRVSEMLAAADDLELTSRSRSAVRALVCNFIRCSFLHARIRTVEAAAAPASVAHSIACAAHRMQPSACLKKCDPP
jgi:hypothetical protein